MVLYSAKKLNSGSTVLKKENPGKLSYKSSHTCKYTLKDLIICWLHNFQQSTNILAKTGSCAFIFKFYFLKITCFLLKKVGIEVTFKYYCNSLTAIENFIKSTAWFVGTFRFALIYFVKDFKKTRATYTMTKP